MAKRILKGLFIVFISVTIVLVVCIAPIDRTPLQEQPFYTEMMQTLDALQLDTHPASKKLHVGWSRGNIMPPYPMPMAGYAPRDQYEEVHDSLYVRTIGINNGGATFYLVSIDLLLFPPALMERVHSKLNAVGGTLPFIYYSATHTHSGMGGWDNSLVGEFSMGNYHDEWIEETSDLIIEQLTIAKTEMKGSSVGYLEANADELVYNRLDRESETDGKIRGLLFIREDSSRAVLVSYSGHPTLLNRKSRIISGDYPAHWIKEIEQQNDFGMFMAGMMGSHAINKFDKKDIEAVEHTGKTLAELTRQNHPSTLDSISIKTKRIPINLGPSQLRIAKNFHIRDWITDAALRPLQAEITYLQFGDIVLLGTSCDFSGEIYINNQLEKIAAQNGKKLMITSFNGNYTGYITADHHYDVLKKEEVRTMNWVGPYFGEYYTDIIEKLLVK